MPANAKHGVEAVNLSGDITSSLEAVRLRKNGLKGIMIGRAAFNTPWVLADVDRTIFGRKNPLENKRELCEQYIDYCREVCEDEGQCSYIFQALTKPLTHLFHGERRSKKFKKILQEGQRRRNFDVAKVVEEALKVLPKEALEVTAEGKRPQFDSSQMSSLP
ncbi:hypothetical protein AAMO2058_001071500 [Amorphochlora amoebiformis]